MKGRKKAFGVCAHTIGRYAVFRRERPERLLRAGVLTGAEMTRQEARNTRRTPHLYPGEITLRIRTAAEVKDDTVFG